jgi:hypothetical protein
MCGCDSRNLAKELSKRSLTGSGDETITERRTGDSHADANGGVCLRQG